MKYLANIEVANHNDFNEILEMEKKYIECAWSETDLKNMLSDKNYTVFKATLNEKIVGYVGVQWCLDEGNICNVAVAEEVRRKHIATSLLLTLENDAKSRNIKTLFLEVNENNNGALLMYEKNGYKVISKRKRYYGNEDAIVMQKQI